MASSPAAPDFVVLGLGNPGAEYEETRHNFGHLLIAALVREEGCPLLPGPGPFRIWPFTCGAKRGIFAQLLTYMNRSGAGARLLRSRFPETPLERWLVVADDLDLPLGRIRFRRQGGAGGHRGLRSLIEAWETEAFPRLRLGIGRPAGDEREEVVDHVLEPFLPAERETVREVLQRGADGVRLFLTEGIDAAMNQCNPG
jgi:PTH1 family peptidyl-tRNA hydrolase